MKTGHSSILILDETTFEVSFSYPHSIQYFFSILLLSVTTYLKIKRLYLILGSLDTCRKKEDISIIYINKANIRIPVFYIKYPSSKMGFRCLVWNY